MRAPSLAVVSLLAALLAVAPPALAYTSQWPQATSDLAANPEVTFGTLPNGLRYAIRRNTLPRDEVSMRLVIEAGSMQETHDQEGLAHLLEHMAFRGSAHVPDGEVIKTLERLGLRFGADANAATSPLETLYRFDLAKPDGDSVDTGLTFLREIASGLTLSQAALDGERRVVLAEERQRAGPSMDIGAAQRAAEFPGHPFTRSPVGRIEVIEGATPAQLRAFYDAYYRPERAVLVVVGDIEPAAIEGKIRGLFSDWTGRGPAGQDPPPYAPTGRARTVVVDAQPGASVTRLSLAWIPPYRAPDQSRAGRIDELVRAIGESALSRRIGEMKEQAGQPFILGGLGSFWIPGVASGESLGAGFVSDLPATIRILTTAQRQAAAGGLTQPEVDLAITSMRAALQQQAAGSFNLPSNQTPPRAELLADEAASGQIDLSDQQRLGLFEEAVKGLTLERVNAALKAQFSGEGPVVFLVTPAPPPGGKAAVEALLDQAAAARLAAYAPPAAKFWTHTNFGAPGRVVERTEVADLGVTMARFANGVRLTIKPSKASPGVAQVLVRFGHGRLDQPRDHLDASDMAMTLVQTGGLDDLKASEISRAVPGRRIAMIARTGDEAFAIGTGPLSVAITDLDLEMQYLAATIAVPGWRSDSWKPLMVSNAQEDQGADATPDSVFERNSAALLHPGDQRWAYSTAQMRAGWTPGEARAFIEPILKRSNLEVIVVGDVTPDQAIAAVAKTFGALPKRDDLPERPGTRDATFPAPTQTPVVLHHAGRADQAVAEISWPTTGRYDGWNDIAASVILADVLKQRVIDQLRTADGDTYSPRGGADFSLVFPNWGRISMLVPCKPEAIGRVYADIDAIAADLAAHPISADELQRAVRPEVESATRSQQQNGYWITQLAGAQTDPRRLDYIRQTLPQLSGVTAADVQRVAAKWLRADRAFRIEVTPEPAAPAATAVAVAPPAPSR
jgi:zinc protease